MRTQGFSREQAVEHLTQQGVLAKPEEPKPKDSPTEEPSLQPRTRKKAAPK